MAKTMILVLLGALAVSASAETKVVKLKGLHCADCVQTLKEKICNDSYAKCEVKLTNSKKELGQLTLETKGKEKVDMVKISKIVEKEGYKVTK